MYRVKSTFNIKINEYSHAPSINSNAYHISKNLLKREYNNALDKLNILNVMTEDEFSHILRELRLIPNNKEPKTNEL